MKKIEILEMMTNKYFKKTFTINNECVFLIGYFSDLQDCGFIFINKEYKKTYTPFNIFVTLNNFFELIIFCRDDEDIEPKFIGIDEKNEASYLSYINSETSLSDLITLKNSEFLSKLKKPLFENYQ